MHCQEEEEGVTEELAYAPITYDDNSSVDFQDKTLLNLTLAGQSTDLTRDCECQLACIVFPRVLAYVLSNSSMPPLRGALLKHRGGAAVPTCSVGHACFLLHAMLDMLPKTPTC